MITDYIDGLLSGILIGVFCCKILFAKIGREGLREGWRILKSLF